MSGSSVWSRSRTVLVKASVSCPTVAAFVALLGILFHNAPALADGCPAPSFAAADEFTVGLVPTSLVTADFNGDGKPDIAVSDQDGVSVLLGKGGGTFQSAVNYRSGGRADYPDSLAVGDFNGDAKPDLVV